VSGAREGFVPNPILAGLVGVCPLIAAATTLASGLAYGLGAALCATALGLIVPSARSLIPDRLQAPATLALSAALALIYGLCLRIYSPVIAAALWIYLPLLAASALSLKSLRLSSAPGRFGPEGKSRLGTIAFESFLFLLTSAFVGALREFLGLGTLTLPMPGFSPARRVLLDLEPLRILVSPAGGFILLGFLVAAHRVANRARRKLAHSTGRMAS
jgi:Na+-translocating ferredoxin:NAD+ oxidoreductase subunit E